MSVQASLQNVARHSVSRVLHRYADFRIGATQPEKRCYKPTDSVLLTFDDHGDKAQVRAILSVLKAKQVRAMFFLEGAWVESSPELVELIRNDGHVIGNHTYSHNVLLKMPADAIRAEITNGIAGPWFRPPQGRYNRRIRSIVHDLGYAICYWTIDSRDWTGASVSTMRHTILSELHPGASILFHIHGAHTAELLPSLIDDIRARGLTLTDFSEPDWRP